MRGCAASPRQVFVVHGETLAADSLRGAIEAELGIDAYVPSYTEEIELN